MKKKERKKEISSDKATKMDIDSDFLKLIWILL